MIAQNKLNEVLSYVNRYNEENGFPPTVRDICSALGIKSTATAYSYINRLREAGLLNKADKKKRAVSLVGSDIVKIPLIGTVTAGQPILAVENYESFYTLPAAEFHGDGLFLLRVRGESMIDAGIFDGDKVVVRKQESAENGDIVVMQIDNEYTVKRFLKNGSGFYLKAENSSGQYPDIFPQEGQEWKLFGVVNYVIKAVSGKTVA